MKYRKKPVVVEAFQLTLRAIEAHQDWPEWLLESRRKGKLSPLGSGHVGYVLQAFHTAWLVDPGDYIIRDENGDLSAVKPEVFEATYEVVGEFKIPTPAEISAAADASFTRSTARFEDLPKADPELTEQFKGLSQMTVSVPVGNGKYVSMVMPPPTKYPTQANKPAQEPELADSDDSDWDGREYVGGSS